MNNNFFKLLKEKAKSYQQNSQNYSRVIKASPGKEMTLPRGLSNGEAFAYKFWAISKQYNASDYFIDEVPFFIDDVIEFIHVLSKAKINSFIVIGEAVSHIPELQLLGCKDLGDSKLFLQESKLYRGELEVYKGKRMRVPIHSFITNDFKSFDPISEVVFKKQETRLQHYYTSFQSIIMCHC